MKDRRFLLATILALPLLACGSTSASSSSGTATSSSSTTTSSSGDTTGPTTTSSASSSSGGGGATSGAGGASSSTSSSSSSGGAGGGCATTPTWTEVLAKPLSNCSGFEPPCHNSNVEGLHFTPSDKNGAWAAFVNVPAMTPGAGVRVVPGDPAHSFLYRKLTNDLTPDEGQPMPQGQGLDPGWKELPQDQIDMVRCWILAGAKND
jgi:hypothetical protein